MSSILPSVTSDMATIFWTVKICILTINNQNNVQTTKQ